MLRWDDTRVSNSFLGLSTKYLASLVREITLRKRGKKKATSFPGFSVMWYVVVYAGLVTYSKLNGWDRDRYSLRRAATTLSVAATHSLAFNSRVSNLMELGITWTQMGC